MGVQRKPIKLLMKVLPVMNHFVCTSFGVSETSYSGLNEKQAGTGQGNGVSVNICRDLLCLVIKEIETDNKGVIIIALITKEIEQQIAVAFVDDTDFTSDGENCIEKMQYILDKYMFFQKIKCRKFGVLPCLNISFFAAQTREKGN